VRLTTLQPSVSRLSRQCGILNISQPARHVTGIAFLLYLESSKDYNCTLTVLSAPAFSEHHFPCLCNVFHRYPEIFDVTEELKIISVTKLDTNVSCKRMGGFYSIWIYSFLSVDSDVETFHVILPHVANIDNRSAAVLICKFYIYLAHCPSILTTLLVIFLALGIRISACN
jgi:hypothetical protein